MKLAWTLLLVILSVGAEDIDNKRSNLRGEASALSEETDPRNLAFIAGSSGSGSGSGQESIVGGTVAAARPWFVEGWGCGGSLVGRDFVLTAAHCWGATAAQSAWPIGYTVWIGNTKTQTVTTGAETKKIKQVFRHPSYNANADTWDYMLVQLDSPVQSTRSLVSLNANFANPAAGAMLTTMGFGTTSSGGNPSTTLLQVTVKTYSQTQCNSMYGGGIVESVMICAGSDTGGKDSCQGDSGGPIVDANNVQVGVVSFGNGCGKAAYPGVYSRVSAAKSWIDQTICTYSASKPCSCTNSCGTTSNPPPTKKPTKAPTKKPTLPTKRPTKAPTKKPVAGTKPPTKKPVAATKAPTKKPTKRPTSKPIAPVNPPTYKPVYTPTWDDDYWDDDYYW